MYTAPHRAIGKMAILKAARHSICIYLKDMRIARHKRCWKRKERIETPSHKEQVRKLRKKLWSEKLLLKKTIGRSEASLMASALRPSPGICETPSVFGSSLIFPRCRLIREAPPFEWVLAWKGKLLPENVKHKRERRSAPGVACGRVFPAADGYPSPRF